MCLPASIATSSALIDFGRPTNSGMTMCGNTTTSRSGSSGSADGIGREGAIPGPWEPSQRECRAKMGSPRPACQAAIRTRPPPRLAKQSVTSARPRPSAGRRTSAAACRRWRSSPRRRCTRDEVGQRRQVVHHVEQHLLEDRAQAARAGLAGQRLAAIARSAGSRISSSTPSMRNIFWYCLISAFFGSTRIWISAASSSSSSVATTGRRPTNSGISPNLIRSSGSVLAQEQR